jgi:DNA-directed RNA polymerase subunit RPC12/RpoP
MPIQPTPTTYHCQKCGWKKTVAPKSDALMPGDHYDTCPECGSKKLKQQDASFIEKLGSMIPGK